MKLLSFIPLFLFTLFSNPEKVKDDYSFYITKKNNLGEETPLCSSSLALYKDSTYYFESGCGCYGESNIATGSWAIVRDTLILTAIPSAKITPVKDIIRTNTKDSTNIHLRLLSRDGDTISENFRPYLLNKQNNTSVKMSDQPFIHDDYIISKDSNIGASTIELLDLSLALDKHVQIETKGYNDITVILNFHSNCVWSNNLYYSTKMMSKFIYKEDSLISLPIHPYGSNYHIVKEK